MLVDLEDGKCRECGGQLKITDFDDVSLFVFCTECEDDYAVETDAFGDGCVKYFFVLQATRLGLDPNDLHQ
jgi:ssDNA-binding Zn-finger/Zn-ribbon topoisomerase 1